MGPEFEDYEAAGAAAAAGRRLFLVRTKGIIDGFETAWQVTGFATKRAAEQYASQGHHRVDLIGWWAPGSRGTAT